MANAWGGVEARRGLDYFGGRRLGWAPLGGREELKAHMFSPNLAATGLALHEPRGSRPRIGGTGGISRLQGHREKSNGLFLGGTKAAPSTPLRPEWSGQSEQAGGPGPPSTPPPFHSRGGDGLCHGMHTGTRRTPAWVSPALRSAGCGCGRRAWLVTVRPRPWKAGGCGGTLASGC